MNELNECFLHSVHIMRFEIFVVEKMHSTLLNSKKRNRYAIRTCIVQHRTFHEDPHHFYEQIEWNLFVYHKTVFIHFHFDGKTTK